MEDISQKAYECDTYGSIYSKPYTTLNFSSNEHSLFLVPIYKPFSIILFNLIDPSQLTPFTVCSLSFSLAFYQISIALSMIEVLKKNQSTP